MKPQWIRSKGAGYQPGTMLLDMPGGGHWSVRKGSGRWWVAALVRNGVAEWAREFMTRREAMELAQADWHAANGAGIPSSEWRGE
jgi:hypothetical protein